MSPHAQGPETNPFAAPQVEDVVQRAAPTEAEAVRRAHINHEASVQGIGSIWMLTAVILGLISLFVTLRLLQQPWDLSVLAFVVLSWGLTGLIGWLGWSLRRLRAQARVPALVMAALALLALPIGTLMGIYMLYILGPDKGHFVLSEPYQQVVLQTPHIRYRTSWVVLVVVGLLLLAIAASLLYPLMGS